MQYTQEQFALLDNFKQGRLLKELSEDDLFVYRFLISEGLLQPRADIEDGWHTLSEKGKMVLENRDKEASDLAKNNAETKKAKTSERLHDFVLVLFGSIITILVEHFGDIILWLKDLFK